MRIVIGARVGGHRRPGVAWPLLVPVAAGAHAVPSARPEDAAAEMASNRVGWAVFLYRWRGRVVYWTRRPGSWSMDARRLGGRRLRLIGFVNVPLPGWGARSEWWGAR